ncbi:MAG: hypothetical protein M9894_10290 [Planctomycetes bacterium]|nr:hypothetical protein [Planctomycetota bacterium]
MSRAHPVALALLALLAAPAALAEEPLRFTPERTDPDALHAVALATQARWPGDARVRSAGGALEVRGDAAVVDGLEVLLRLLDAAAHAPPTDLWPGTAACAWTAPDAATASRRFDGLRRLLVQSDLRGAELFQLPERHRLVVIGGGQQVRLLAGVLDLLAREAPARADRLTVKADDADLREVVADLARRAGQRVSVAPEVEERVTVDLRDVRFEEALRVIARMARCEVSNGEDGEWRLEPTCVRVLLELTDADARTVLQLVAAYARRSVVLHSEVAGRVTVGITRSGWDASLLAIADALGLEVFAYGADDVLLVAPAGTPSKGAPLRLADAPAPPPPGPRLPLLRARGAPLGALAPLLAQAGGFDLVVGAGAERALRLDLRDVDPWRALAALADALDLELSPGAPARLRARGPAVEPVPAAAGLQAVVHTAAGWRAVIDGRVYRPGDEVVDEHGDGTGVVVAEVDAAGVLLRQPRDGAARRVELPE